MRTARSGQRRFDRGKIEFQRVVIVSLALKAPDSLSLAVGFNQRALLFAAAGFAQIADGFFIDGKKAHRRAVFRRHVGDRTAVGQTQIGRAFAVELDEFPDHPFFAQQTGDRQRQIRGGNAGLERAGEFKADHFRRQNRNRLAEHRRLGFDPSDAPAQHAHAVDRRRVAVRSDERVGIGDSVLKRYAGRQIFHINLMADAQTGRKYAQFFKSTLPPFQKLIALAVALKLARHVELQRRGTTGGVELHGMIHHQIHRHLRLNPRRIFAGFLHRRAQRRQIDHARHAGKVLQEHAGRHKGQLDQFTARRPLRQLRNMLRRIGRMALHPEQRLQQYLHRKRHTGKIIAALFFQLRQAVVTDIGSRQFPQKVSFIHKSSPIG